MIISYLDLNMHPFLIIFCTTYDNHFQTKPERVTLFKQLLHKKWSYHLITKTLYSVE